MALYYVYKHMCVNGAKRVIAPETDSLRAWFFAVTGFLPHQTGAWI